MSADVFRNPLTQMVATFLREIGLPVRVTPLGQTRLPGIDIRCGGLDVDEDKLVYPGDLLHEAGHLAVMPPARRACVAHDLGNDLGEEMMAIAWSYAAALHLGIDPEIVFHEGGYGTGDLTGGRWIVENFREGRTFGIPLLQWVGMTYDERRAAEDGVKPYPHMLRWLREHEGDPS